MKSVSDSTDSDFNVGVKIYAKIIIILAAKQRNVDVDGQKLIHEIAELILQLSTQGRLTLAEDLMRYNSSGRIEINRLIVFLTTGRKQAFGVS